ncbi:MAG: 30S ribosomal protein S17 [Candidatus Jacksonbacteria bacterium]|nr:30S ribosomal protein S17 [Candidatus Jacksonbacteria bacterium]
MEHKKHKRRQTGVITSNAMQKTVVVEITRIKVHPKYRKRYASAKKFKAHDQKNEYKIGDTVTIEECKPISKEKRWKVIQKIA